MINTVKDYVCSASLEAGLLKLESGETINLALVEQTLVAIAQANQYAVANSAQLALDSLHCKTSANTQQQSESAESAQASSPKLEKLEGSRNVYIEAYANDDYGDGPSFAFVKVDQEFLDKLTRMQKICIDNKLSEVREFSGPDAWGPGGIESELRLQYPELVITEHAFWFADRPKHTNYTIESRSQMIAEFVQKVLSQPAHENLLTGDSINYSSLIDDDGGEDGEESTAVNNPALSA